ncbi:MAG TPA: hemerythrin domain-containing protein [Azospirillum sp.]|nr:hemerythrin domain-containing protein [Azospirillum sp.]
MAEAALLAWKDAWSVDVPEIDRQHAALMAEFARLIDPARRDDYAFQRAALVVLTGHVCRHFDYEEHLMHVHHYPDFGPHAEAHAELLKQLNHFEMLVKAQPEDGPGPDIVAFVGRWLFDHTQGDDKRLGTFLRDRHEVRKAS